MSKLYIYITNEPIKEQSQDVQMAVATTINLASQDEATELMEVLNYAAEHLSDNPEVV